jgi:hypothetical protein
LSCLVCLTFFLSKKKKREKQKGEKKRETIHHSFSTPFAEKQKGDEKREIINQPIPCHLPTQENDTR